MNFGAAKVTGGFTLTTPATTGTNPGLLGAGDSRTIGAQAQATPPQLGKAPAYPLAFSSAPAASTPGGGFPLGTPASTVPGGGFQLGTTASPGAQTLQFRPQPTTTAAVASPIGFQLAQPPATTNLTLGTPGTTAQTLTLGTPSTAAPNFNLGSSITTSSATGFSLGGISSTGLTFSTPASSATAGAGFTLGKTPQSAASTATSSAGLSLISSTAAASSSAPSTTTAGATAAAAAIPGGLTFNQLEESLNKWTLELEEQGKMFMNQALQLNAWDRLVISNSEKIITLNDGIEKVKGLQTKLDRDLDFVLGQQRELEECIIPLEKELKNIPATDQDRNRTYQMAENMDTQLKLMSEDLKEIIEHLNESNKTEDTDDPVSQIGRILNAHMNSLQWIDRNTEQINNCLDNITKMHDVHRRDNERSFHLTYEHLN